MVDQGLDGAQDVAEVLAISFERETPGGQPWCHPRECDLVQRWIGDQGRELAGAIRRLSRLVHIMALADGQYSRFLYQRINVLRAPAFVAALRQAQGAGRLPAARVMLDADGAILAHGAMGGAFSIPFAHMPRLCLLLDVLHNALGFAAVADVLEGLGRRDVPAAAFETASAALETMFQAWLGARLDSRHHLRQAKVMRAYLAATGGIASHRITDTSIFDFWRGQATGPADRAIDGFRLFTSAARAMLIYRTALADAEAAHHIRRAGDLDSYERVWSNLPDGEDHAPAGASAWLSPLDKLARDPACAVKWLTKKETQFLVHYLGCRDDDGGDVSDRAPDGAVSRSCDNGGLAGDGRFDLQFLRTLARADVFGAAQASIIGRLRKRQAGCVDAVCLLLARDAFERTFAIYREIEDQLALEARAAIVRLALDDAGHLAGGATDTGGPTGALGLIGALGEHEALAALASLAASLRLRVAGSALATVDPADVDPADADITDAAVAEGIRGLERALVLALREPARLPASAARAFFTGALAAARKVHRQGFQIAANDGADGASPATASAVAGLRASAPVVAELLRDVARLRQAAERAARSGQLADAEADIAQFTDVFRAMYEP